MKPKSDIDRLHDAEDIIRKKNAEIASLKKDLRGMQQEADTAAAIGWSDRQLHRRALRTFGYGPKTLARVLRFRTAVDLARAGGGFARIAADCGYSDQAHLAREVRALCGTTLTDLAG